MNELEFLVLAVSQWETLAGLTLLSAAALFWAIRRVIVGGVFDPLVLALVLGYSVNYAVVALLLLNGGVSSYLAFLVFAYGLTFVLAFRAASQRRGPPALTGIVRAIALPAIGSTVFAVSLSIYLLLSTYIISSIGFGIFAETNRFDAGRGFGAYIRLLDFLSPFIVAYSTLHIASAKRPNRLKIASLLLFVVYAAMVNGAKISVIFSMFTILFTLSIAELKLRMKRTAVVAFLAIGVGFSVLALSINLQRNQVEEGIAETNLGGGLVVEKFVYRLIAAGDTSYLLLPNAVIDKIETDSVWVRFIVPFIGISGGSSLFGYPVGDYSVGRQALLFYDSTNDVSGGPTSHFDLFAYVYFGPIAGWLFVALLGAMLGAINRAIRAAMNARILQTRPMNKFEIAFLATLWTRAVLVIVEPTVALAYIVDVFLFFALLSLCLQLILVSSSRSLRRPASA